jgi:hypothetical protein
MMKRLKLAGLLAAAVLVVGAAAASSASAVEMRLPSFSNVTINAGTDVSLGASTFFGAVALKCDSNTSQFVIAATGKEGSFTLDFEGCTAVGEECHSLGDKPGIILMGGTWHLVLDTLAGVDSRLILFEPKELHSECKLLTSLVLLKGNFLGKIEGVRGIQFTIGTFATSATGQEFKEYENNSGTSVKTQLLSNTNGGTFAESGLDLGTDRLTLEKETEIVN